MKLIDMNFNMHNFVLKLGNLKKSLSSVYYYYYFFVSSSFNINFLFKSLQNIHIYTDIYLQKYLNS